MPPIKFVVRSTEYGNGTEFSEGETCLPDHYQKRLWRKSTPVLGQGGKDTILVTYTNKDVSGRKLSYSAMFEPDAIVITGGSGGLVAKIGWTGAKSFKNCMFTMDDIGRPLSVVFRKSSNIFGDQSSHKFITSDNQEWKWKRAIPISMDEADSYWTLQSKDSKHPIATTQRLVGRDGGDYTTGAYPVYISERGLAQEELIICSLLVLDTF